jgi:hypothetical protein
MHACSQGRAAGTGAVPKHASRRLPVCEKVQKSKTAVRGTRGDGCCCCCCCYSHHDQDYYRYCYCYRDRYPPSTPLLLLLLLLMLLLPPPPLLLLLLVFLLLLVRPAPTMRGLNNGLAGVA